MNVLKYMKKRDFQEGADCLWDMQILMALKSHVETSRRKVEMKFEAFDLRKVIKDIIECYRIL